jgi:hypothetical protein
VEEFHVCRNIGDHMLGNVYIKCPAPAPAPAPSHPLNLNVGLTICQIR